MTIENLIELRKNSMTPIAKLVLLYYNQGMKPVMSNGRPYWIKKGVADVLSSR